MVEGVGQRILGDSHWAEDALQATCIVLARRAHSHQVQDSLATWLYNVAQRVALRARAQMAARRDRERKVAAMGRTGQLDEATWEELRPILDEEVGRLAEKYRAPIVLCPFQRKNRRLAARRWHSLDGHTGNQGKATSNDKEGANIGFPQEPSAIAAFFGHAPLNSPAADRGGHSSTGGLSQKRRVANVTGLFPRHSR
jgi:hypothetical protein